jgi:hypothetical protein
MADDADSFLSRWSRRKAGVRSGAALAAEPAAALPAAAASPQPTAEAVPVAPQTASSPPDAAPAAPATPPPTMADVALLTRDADYTRYLGSSVSPEVKNAALKHLFTDPHFNVMDGLDIYVGDYNTPDPMPAGMLRQMVQSQLLGLFDDEVEADTKPRVALTADDPAAAAPPPTADPTFLAADENPDLQLQPDDDAGRPGAEAGPGAHAGRPD